MQAVAALWAFIAVWAAIRIVASFVVFALHDAAGTKPTAHVHKRRA